MSLLEVSSKDYEEALSISEESDFQIHYRRAPNSCFVKNYFCDGLMAWEANMDIQPAFNYYKAYYMSLLIQIRKWMFISNETSSLGCIWERTW